MLEVDILIERIFVEERFGDTDMEGKGEKKGKRQKRQFHALAAAGSVHARKIHLNAHQV